MKKMLVIILGIVMSSSLTYAQYSEVEYVQTAEKDFFFTNLRSGLTCFLVGTYENGEKVRFKKDEVIAYKKWVMG